MGGVVGGGRRRLVLEDAAHEVRHERVPRHVREGALQDLPPRDRVTAVQGGAAWGQAPAPVRQASYGPGAEWRRAAVLQQRAGAARRGS